MIGMLFCQNIRCPTLRAVNVTLHVTMHVSLQLRQALDALLNDMKNLPARLKQYSSFEYVQKTIKTYLKVSNTMSFLTSRIDRDRATKQMKLGNVFSGLCLWKQGELSIEEWCKRYQ